MPRPKKLDATPIGEDAEATAHEPVDGTERFLSFQRGSMRKRHIREEDDALPDPDRFIDPSELWP